MPTPRPDRLVICSAVEKPGLEDQVETSPSLRPRWLDQAALQRLGQDALAFEATAVVTHFDDDAADSWKALSRTLPRRACAGEPLLGRLDAMVNGVAHQMEQRVADLRPRSCPAPCPSPEISSVMSLPSLARHVMDHALELGEGGADLDHAQLQRAGTRPAPGRPGAGGFDELAVFAFARQQLGAGTRDDEFADQGDQLIEAVGIDADGAMSAARCWRSPPLCFCLPNATSITAELAWLSTRIFPIGGVPASARCRAPALAA